GQTGGKVAIPIFRPIVEAVFAHHAPRTALAPPSPEAGRELIALQIDPRTGERVQRGLSEPFRLDRTGRLAETRYALVPDHLYGGTPWYRGDGWDEQGPGSGPYAEIPDRRDPRQRDPSWFERHGQAPWWYGDAPRQPRRIDPDYFWGFGRIY
ncbi:MAG TPA: glycosyl transferase, partial [Beijerinckiaceae bacterium]|nr:glycosyl transferase [Beijerinckiaceae bacterium]